jgi:NhaP-type Na+/H+ or K+/H+ antiporter
MTLFCCGFAMGHYAFKNLSAKSKIGSVLAIETIGHGAEAFLFTYLGLCIYGIDQQKFSSPFFIVTLLSCMIARAVGVFVPYFIVGMCKCFKMSITLK